MVSRRAIGQLNEEMLRLIDFGIKGPESSSPHLGTCVMLEKSLLVSGLNFLLLEIRMLVPSHSRVRMLC